MCVKFVNQNLKLNVYHLFLNFTSIPLSFDTRGGFRGGAPGARHPNIGKNMIRYELKLYL